MVRHLWFVLILLSLCSAHAAEILVKSGTVTATGYSSAESDLSVVYGGMAGNVGSCTGDTISPCNTCVLSSGSADACNQTSVYPTLKLSVSFKLTKAVSNAVAKLAIDNSSGTCCDTLATLPAASYTENSTITIETTWADICTSAGINCTSGTSATLVSKNLRFGVDSDASGSVEEAEMRSLTLKFHYLPVGTSEATQAYCSSMASGSGVCNIAFLPGDKKVYIDTAIYAGADSTALPWESIAVFPVAAVTGGEAGIYSAFQTKNSEPILKSIDTDGNIPDSQVAGGIENYQYYCMVYGTRNKAGNIYKFVTTGIDTTKSCLTPAEVVGILDDKHCFISTAAFGSESAPEVEIFRKFRNSFLATNSPGKLFIKLYYKLSPPLAEIISGNEYLKTSTRILLYPLLAFAFLSLKAGIGSALLILGAAIGLLLWSRRFFVRKKSLALFLLILFLLPSVKAEIIPEEKEISHPNAQQGLVRIKKDGTYIYDTERPLKSESSRFTFGQADQPEISLSIQPVDANNNPTGPEKVFNFQDFYNETSGLILGYDYEKFISIDHGKFGYQLGFGAMIVTGNGRLKADPNDPSVESFTFVTLPINAGGVYRFEYKDKQLFAPYVSGGGTYVALLEKREDKAAPDFAGGFGFYGAGGGLLNIGALDPDTGFELDSEYGITNLWVSLEFRIVEVSNDAFTFSNKYINAGLSFDF